MNPDCYRNSGRVRALRKSKVLDMSVFNALEPLMDFILNRGKLNSERLLQLVIKHYPVYERRLPCSFHYPISKCLVYYQRDTCNDPFWNSGRVYDWMCGRHGRARDLIDWMMRRPETISTNLFSNQIPHQNFYLGLLTSVHMTGKCSLTEKRQCMTGKYPSSCVLILGIRAG